MKQSELPQGMDDLVQLVRSTLLDERKLGHVVIIIDAIDQVFATVYFVGPSNNTYKTKFCCANICLKNWVTYIM